MTDLGISKICFSRCFPDHQGVDKVKNLRGVDWWTGCCCMATGIPQKDCCSYAVHAAKYTTLQGSMSASQRIFSERLLPSWELRYSVTSCCTFEDDDFPAGSVRVGEKKSSLPEGYSNRGHCMTNRTMHKISKSLKITRDILASSLIPPKWVPSLKLAANLPLKIGPN